METQKIIPPPNSTDSHKRTPPGIPQRPGAAVTQPHRAPPPVPIRPTPNNTNDQGKTIVVGKTDEKTRVTVQSEMNNVHVDSTKPEQSKFKVDESQTEADMGKLEQNNVDMKGAVLRRPHRPPPLPPRPTSSSLSEETNVTEAHSVETQTSPLSPIDTNSKLTGPPEVSNRKPPLPRTGEKPAVKPQLKPKPKPRPRPRPKMGDTSDKQDEAYNEVPPPRPVGVVSQGKMAEDSDDQDEPYHEVPPPRPVRPTQGKMAETSDDESEPYNEVPPPRPVWQPKMADTSESHNQVPPPRPVVQVSHGAESSNNKDKPYTKAPLPRPAGRGSPEGARTQGETSRNEMGTTMERGGNELSAPKRTELKIPRNGAGGDTIPVPAPRIKKMSHSLGEIVERKIHLECIDLTREPYSDQVSC